MKTRRIHLQPGECAEIVNTYGTSMLKVTTRFDGSQPFAVIYEQPDVTAILSSEIKSFDLTFEPTEIAPDLTEQNGDDLPILDH